MADSPKRSFLGKVLLAVASTALTLLALEGFARVFLTARGGGKERAELLQYVVHDPRLGWRKRPGARVTYERREYTVEVAVNTRGLRDNERAYAASPGTFRVLALGDSFVEGYSVAFEDTVEQVLETHLSRPRCSVEVINGGTAGYSTDQEYLWYQDEGSKYSPDVVALFFHYNDIVANNEAKYYGTHKPLLTFTDGGYRIRNFPVPKPKPKGPPRGPRRRPEGSALFAWIRERVLTGAPRAYNSLARFGLWPDIGGEEPDDPMKVYKRRRLPVVEAAWQETAQILAALAREVERHGSRFVVVYVPGRFEVSDRDWELTRVSYDMKEGAWDRSLVTRRLNDIAEASSFSVLDLTRALRRVDQGFLGGPYYEHDGHWNARGHRVAAAELEVFLREHGWLPACVGGTATPAAAR